MVYRYIGLGELLARGEAAALAATNEGANKLVQLAQAEAPIDEGTLAASIHTEGAKPTGSGAVAVVQTGGEASDYAIPQHEGAGPHEIRPKNGRALAFNGIVVSKVNHPGNPPTKFMERPLLAFAPIFIQTARAMMRRAF